MDEIDRPALKSGKNARKTILVENPTEFPDDIQDKCPQGVIYIGEKPENADEKELIRYWREHAKN